MRDPSRSRWMAAMAALLALVVGAALLFLWPRGGGAPYGGDTSDGPERAVRRAGPLSDRVDVHYPQPGRVVTSPLVVAGEAPGGWHFEATFPLRLVTAGAPSRADGGGESPGSTLADSFATARGEWMTEGQVPFRGVLRFPERVPGTDARDVALLLKRSNASGLPEHDASVRIPVRLAGPATARVYFPSEVLDPEAADCRRVHPVARDTTGGAAGATDGGGPDAASDATGGGPAAAARRLLAALLAGPDDAERAAGYHTALPEDAAVRSVALRGDTLSVDFDSTLSKGVAGACRVRAIRAQVDSTLVGLPGVGRVVLSVEGRVAEALQP